MTRKIWAVDQVYKVIKARAQALQDYNKALDRVNQKVSQTLWFEESGMMQIWSSMVKMDEGINKAYTLFLKNVNDTVLAKLTEMKNTLEQTKKKVFFTFYHHT